jgi:HlyD family secretion protein
VSKRKISKSSQNGQLNQSIGFMNKSLDIFWEWIKFPYHSTNFWKTLPLNLYWKTYVKYIIGSIDDRKGYKLITDIDEFYLGQ